MGNELPSALLEQEKRPLKINQNIGNNSDMGASKTSQELQGVFLQILDSLAENHGWDYIMSKITGGHFTMRKMRKLMGLMCKLGSKHKIYSSFSGMDWLKIKQYCVITDSMNNEELHSRYLAVVMDESRIYRVARGSGSPLERVRELIQVHLHLSKFLRETFNEP